MNRRKFLIGAGSFAAAGAAALGTGAIDTTTAQRGMAVDVAGDEAAYLGIDPNADSDFVNYEDGTVSLDFGFEGDGGGTGVNKAGYTEVRPAFRLRNQANGPMYIGIRNSLRNGDISSSQANNTGWTGGDAVAPEGFDFQFVVADNVPDVGTDSVGLIDRQDPPSSYGGNFGAAYDPTKVSRTAGRWGAYRHIDADEKCGYVELGAGQEVPVIARAVVTPDFDLDGLEVPDVAFQVNAVDDEGSTRLDDNLTDTLTLGL